MLKTQVSPQHRDSSHQARICTSNCSSDRSNYDHVYVIKMSTTASLHEIISTAAEYKDQAMSTFDAAMEAGVTFWDTAYIYASPTGAHNETLVGEAISKHGRDNITLVRLIGVPAQGRVFIRTVQT